MIRNERGFAPLLILLVFAVLGLVGFTLWRAVDAGQNNQTKTSQVAQPLSVQDQATLVQAKELKKVDFDLDGKVNSVDQDDDNDGQSDDADQDDDNDGAEDDEDNDDDNDGAEDDDDDEAKQQAELED